MSGSAHEVKPHALGFFQLDPIPSLDDLNVFYQSRYYDLLRGGGRAPELRRLLEAGDERAAELHWLQDTLYGDLAEAIAPFARDREVLDIGCGAGDFIAWLGAQGWRASGVDPSTDAVAAATARGVEAHCTTLEAWSASSANAGRYGAVTLVNVLEHVPDPLGVLATVRALLDEGGVASVRVPNDFSALQTAARDVVDRQDWWITAPDHINYFSAKTLSAAFIDQGFEVVDVSADFPMEFFLLMGVNYVDDPKRGGDAHQMRRNFDLALPRALRRALNRAHASLGLGRNILVTARRV